MSLKSAGDTPNMAGECNITLLPQVLLLGWIRDCQEPENTVISVDDEQSIFTE